MKLTIEMTDNGRLVIPLKIRKALGLSGPTKLDVVVKDGAVVLIPVTTVPMDRPR